MKALLSFVVSLWLAGFGWAAADSTSGVPVDTLAEKEASALPEGAIRIDQVKRGQSVILHGIVQRIRDEDELILKDDTGRIEIYLGRLGRMPVKVGEVLTVHGRADDDVFPGRRPEIYASKLILSDGTEIPVQQWD